MESWLLDRGLARKRDCSNRWIRNRSSPGVVLEAFGALGAVCLAVICEMGEMGRLRAWVAATSVQCRTSCLVGRGRRGRAAAGGVVLTGRELNG